MDYEAQQSLPAMFIAQAATLGGKPFLWHKSGGAWKSMSWRRAARQVNLLAGGLVSMGLAPGDRVALVAESRPEWPIADLAIMAAGAISVPGFTTNTAADHEHILTDSGARGAIVSSRAIAGRLLPAALRSDLRFLVAMEEVEASQPAACEMLRWEEALRRGEGRSDDIAARVGRLRRNEVCCFIYTSGTGGRPKGVMLTHGSILANCMGAYHVLRDIGLGDDVFLSFLPLSHSYEHTTGLFFPISIGAQIRYAESVERLAENMTEVRPTIMTAVPRLYETMHRRMLHAVEKADARQRRLFALALDLGRRKYERPGSLSFRERLLDLVAERLVRRRVSKRFGGRLKGLVSGGAALNYEIGIFFHALGVPILQGYGLTEASPVISVNPPGRVKLHTVGRPVRGVELRIAGDGEILVRGELVMLGYWGDPVATDAVIRDGWLHTGDVGVLDADGYLQITDRKKDIIVLSGGDNVSPARIEGLLVLQPEIHQAMVHGDRQPHLVALLVPEADFVRSWANGNGRSADLATLSADPEFHRALGATVERVNSGLSAIERIRRFAVAPEPFTIENAMMTPSLKNRRHKIREAYCAVLERLYEKGS